jgi:hypothetical protein
MPPGVRLGCLSIHLVLQCGEVALAGQDRPALDSSALHDDPIAIPSDHRIEQLEQGAPKTRDVDGPGHGSLGVVQVVVH